MVDARRLERSVLRLRRRDLQIRERLSQEAADITRSTVTADILSQHWPHLRRLVLRGIHLKHPEIVVSPLRLTELINQSDGMVLSHLVDAPNTRLIPQDKKVVFAKDIKGDFPEVAAILNGTDTDTNDPSKAHASDKKTLDAETAAALIRQDAYNIGCIDYTYGMEIQGRPVSRDFAPQDVRDPFASYVRIFLGERKASGDPLVDALLRDLRDVTRDKIESGEWKVDFSFEPRERMVAPADPSQALSLTAVEWERRHDGEPFLLPFKLS